MSAKQKGNYEKLAAKDKDRYQRDKAIFDIEFKKMGVQMAAASPCTPQITTVPIEKTPKSNRKAQKAQTKNKIES